MSPVITQRYSRCFFENYTEHTGTVRTLQQTHYVSATETKWLVLFGKTVVVYCEKHTELTDTVRTSQETHYVFVLFGETVAVCCENHTEHRCISYLTGNILLLRVQPVNALWEKQSLLIVRTIRNTQIQFRTSQKTHYISATETNWLLLFRETVAVYGENGT
jgi:hypothetical protein